jgi:hypothetical protein
MAEQLRKCPKWCASEHEFSDHHHSDAPWMIVRGIGLRALAWQFPGKRRHVSLSGVAVTGPRTADAFARLLDRLADASPEQHRELAGQVRTAAVIAFGTEAMEGFR